MMNKAVVSWSGGKDSCYALYQASLSGTRPVVLLNVLNEEGKISRSHGIPAEILQAQAAALNLPMHLVASSWQEYELKFTTALKLLKAQYELSSAVFGDIDLEEHKAWEERVCTQSGLNAVLPIWQQNRKKLVLDMLDWGIKTIIVSCNETMGVEYLGKVLTPALISDLEALGVDPCGENGEFHTLVTDCPLFKKPIAVQTGSAQKHDQYWFIELTLQP